MCEVSLPQRGSRKAWSPRRPAAGEKEMEMLRRGSNDYTDPYVKFLWGFPNVGKECEWREVLHGAKREFVVPMSVVLQQNYVCGGGGGCIERWQLPGTTLAAWVKTAVSLAFQKNHQH